MLKEINCPEFIKNPITFSNGLNTVLGDDYSTNSIGKSTLLMIIDFVFGGNSFLDKNSGAINIIGDLNFKFYFEFDSVKHFYSRSTSNPELVAICDKEYNLINEIKVNSYTSGLKEKYDLKVASSFRAAINPYSRIWGKDNYNVEKPILNSIKEAEKVSVENLVKLFNLYDEISKTSNEIKSQEESKKILQGMVTKSIVPKVTKTEFKKNEIEIERLESEINDIQNNLFKYTLNIEELSNNEVISLKTQKHKLLQSQSRIQNKIKRIEINLNNKNVKGKYFNQLSQFFENPNEKKINEIEEFHNGLSKILQRELKATRDYLISENEKFQAKLQEIDFKIDGILSNVQSPKFIVDKVYDLTIEANKLKQANKYYKQKVDAVEEVKTLNKTLDKTIEKILTDIESKINTELVRINKEIHTEKKKVPRIHLKRKKYHFDHSSNTGTGKSYADLIEFDLSILKLTDLPLIIHDSVLFKNVEDVAVDKIIEQYSKFKKQIFIALDGINKFSDESQKVLKEKCVLHLTESKKLFNRDWR